MKCVLETTADGFLICLPGSYLLWPVLHGDFTPQFSRFPHFIAVRCLLLYFLKRKAERSKCGSADRSVSSG